METQHIAYGAETDSGSGFDPNGQPHQEFASPPQGQAYNPNQQQLDPVQYQQALENLQKYQAYEQQMEEYVNTLEARDAEREHRMSQAEQQRAAEAAMQRFRGMDAQAIARLYQRAQQIKAKKDYDPDGAIQDAIGLAVELHQGSVNQRQQLLAQFGEAIQQVENRYTTAEVARYHAEQEIGDPAAAEYLRTLPPNQIPVIAQMLGRPVKQVQQLQQEIQQLRAQSQQAARQNPAFAQPVRSAQPVTNDPTEDEAMGQLIGWLLN